MDWIQTYSGRQFFVLEPRVADIDIGDIAHALSLQCRFNGHCREFYSVAEHSVRVSHLLEGSDALWGLMHDAAEAYVADLPRPVKRQMPQFSEMEERVLKAIVESLGLAYPMPESVRRADDTLLATEQRDVMAPPPADWLLDPTLAPLAQRITPMNPAEAERAFLARYTQLTAHGVLT